MKLKKLKGTKDFFDFDINLFDVIKNIINYSALKYCYKKIDTPIIEMKSLFCKPLGFNSDIIEKEIYSFSDYDSRIITLRPEFTSAIVRLIINNLCIDNTPYKFFSYGPIFRYERPQKLRFRQFNQFNFEYIGEISNSVDCELLLLAYNIINSLDIEKHVELNINNIGSYLSMNKYKISLVNYLSSYKYDLSEIDKNRLIYNPLRILDSKDKKIQIILKDAPNIYNYINNQSKKNMYIIEDALNNLNVKYKIKKTLVRGLDYYSDLIFEFNTLFYKNINTIIGGGRYNNLLYYMCNKNIPASGFSGGIERIMCLVKKINYYKQIKTKTIYLIPIGLDAEKYSKYLSKKLREKFIVHIYYNLSLRKRIHKINNKKKCYIIFFGDSEIKNRMFKIKNVETGSIDFITIEKLYYYLNIKLIK